MAAIKNYFVSVLEDGEFIPLVKTTRERKVRDEINAPEYKFKFIRVDNFTYHDSGNKKGKRELVGVSIYLGGICILRDYEVTVESIEELKKTLTTLYKVDGDILFYPPVQYSIQDLRDMLGLTEKEFPTIKVVQDGPPSYAVIQYDWSSFGSTKQKVKNVKASNRFGIDLYGNVLFVDENLVS
jgi:hypothetical protein